MIQTQKVNKPSHEKNKNKPLSSIRLPSSFQVSWIRKSDLHVLTSNVVTYTGEERFRCIHQEYSDDWTLQITNTQMNDAGEYQCQVSTEPKMSLLVNLVVTGQNFFLPGLPRLRYRHDRFTIAAMQLILDLVVEE